MAVTTGTIQSTSTVKPDRDETTLQAELVLFTISGTYATADGSQILAVDTAIQNSRRNGKTVTLIDAVLYQPAFDAATAGLLLGAKTIAVSGSNITFHLTEGSTPNVLDVSTEFTNSTAIPAMGSPMGFLVTFTEA
jgi:hypothetical protein